MKYSIYEIHQHDMLISNNTDNFFILKKLDNFVTRQQYVYNSFSDTQDAELFIGNNKELFNEFIDYTIIPSFRINKEL